MRLHTSLTYAQVNRALTQAKDAGHVTRDVKFIVFDDHKSKSHARAFEVQLGTYNQCSLPAGYRDQYGKLMHVRRYKNTGTRGAGECDDRVWSATWHEWGWFMAFVFALDPDARFGSLKGWGYYGYADFMAKTRDQFGIEPTPEKRTLDEDRERGCDVNYGEFDFLPPREHDMRAFGRVIEDESTIMHDTVREQTGEDA